MNHDLTALEAESVISSLRSGTVPNRFVSSYSASGDFATRVSSRHFKGEYEQGKIRFVSGNWGSGKTHFLMRLRE
jgi:chromosomal replication initiation ATPase DnaA